MQATAKPQNRSANDVVASATQLRSAQPRMLPVASATEKVTLALSASQKLQQHLRTKLVWTLPFWEQ